MAMRREKEEKNDFFSLENVGIEIENGKMTC